MRENGRVQRLNQYPVLAWHSGEVPMLRLGTTEPLLTDFDALLIAHLCEGPRGFRNPVRRERGSTARLVLWSGCRCVRG